ncbi:hypothetical protein [Amycolatopsis anabasis]|uniref:hypothetical protein n=1 Tax=Amycolatopsis anabasis TaxID=1840409 RepID=UPI00131D4B4B|nr:hypothetical protein [Amycolatopsis anabasis]
MAEEAAGGGKAPGGGGDSGSGSGSGGGKGSPGGSGQSGGDSGSSGNKASGGDSSGGSGSSGSGGDKASGGGSGSGDKGSGGDKGPPGGNDSGSSSGSGGDKAPGSGSDPGGDKGSGGDKGPSSDKGPGSSQSGSDNASDGNKAPGGGGKSGDGQQVPNAEKNSGPQGGDQQQRGHEFDNQVLAKSPTPETDSGSLRETAQGLRDAGNRGQQAADQAQQVARGTEQEFGGKPGDQLRQNLNEHAEHARTTGADLNRLAGGVDHAADVVDATKQARQQLLDQGRRAYDTFGALAPSGPEAQFAQEHVINQTAAQGQKINQQAAAAMKSGSIWDILDPRNHDPVTDGFRKTVVEPLAEAEQRAKEGLNWLYSEKSEGSTGWTNTSKGFDPDFDVTASSKNGPKPELKVLNVGGKELYDRGRFSALGGLVQGSYEDGLFASGNGKMPLGQESPGSVDFQAGRKWTLDKINLGDKVSIQPDLRVGPGGSLGLDVDALKEGRLKPKFSFSPWAGGGLGLDVDLKGIGNWFVDKAREINDSGTPQISI